MNVCNTTTQQQTSNNTNNKQTTDNEPTTKALTSRRDMHNQLNSGVLAWRRNALGHRLIVSDTSGREQLAKVEIRVHEQRQRNGQRFEGVEQPLVVREVAASRGPGADSDRGEELEEAVDVADVEQRDGQIQTCTNTSRMRTKSTTAAERKHNKKQQQQQHREAQRSKRHTFEHRLKLFVVLEAVIGVVVQLDGEPRENSEERHLGEQRHDHDGGAQPNQICATTTTS